MLNKHFGVLVDSRFWMLVAALGCVCFGVYPPADFVHASGNCEWTEATEQGTSSSASANFDETADPEPVSWEKGTFSATKNLSKAKYEAKTDAKQVLQLLAESGTGSANGGWSLKSQLKDNGNLCQAQNSDVAGSASGTGSVGASGNALGHDASSSGSSAGGASCEVSGDEDGKILHAQGSCEEDSAGTFKLGFALDGGNVEWGDAQTATTGTYSAADSFNLVFSVNKRVSASTVILVGAHSATATGACNANGGTLVQHNSLADVTAEGTGGITTMTLEVTLVD